MKTAERLQSYGIFDTEVIEAVAETAEWQNSLSFDELAEHYDVGESFSKVYAKGYYNPIETLTLTPPDGEYDETEVMVYHLDHNSAISNDKIVRVVRLMGSMPNKRFMVAGNPSSIGMKAGRLTLTKSMEVYSSGSLAPTVDPLLLDLSLRRITKAGHIGSSEGAVKTITAAGRSSLYDIAATDAVAVEPVNVTDRTMPEFVRAFRSVSRDKQWEYIRGAESRPLNEFWDNDSFLKFGLWFGGLLRPTNIAATRALCVGNYFGLADTALLRQPDMHLGTVWGTDSELVVRDDIRDVNDRLRLKFSQQRVSGIEVPGMTHTGMDDPDLAAALVMQAMKR